ncbi:DUF4238 domain-containing protein [Microbacterium sp. NPDC090003]|uniref:DUF4238 domain-containing protein n=1 Tax=Microbacterium sp. NPDC090003 TaxID=3364203 RepID=UPI00382420EC
MSTPKKHHYVPQMLLRRFAHDGRLWHVPVDREDVPRKQRPTDIGHVNGGHNLIRLDGTVDRVSMERAMGEIESEASKAITALEQDESLDVVPPELASPIAWLASLQRARSRARLGYIAESVSGSRDDDPHKGTAFDLQSSLLRVGTVGLFNAWSLRDDETARPKDRWDFTTHALLGMRWDVMRYSDRCLAISDEFAAQYGVRVDARGDFTRDPWSSKFGLNTPLWAATGATIALTPQLALSLHHGDHRKPTAAASVNMHTIRSARSFVAFPTDYELERVLESWALWIQESRFVRDALPRAL